MEFDLAMTELELTLEMDFDWPMNEIELVKLVIVLNLVLNVMELESGLVMLLLF